MAEVPAISRFTERCIAPPVGHIRRYKAIPANLATGKIGLISP